VCYGQFNNLNDNLNLFNLFIMKKSAFLFCLLMLSGSFLFAQQATVKFVDVQVIIGNRPPSPSEAQLMRAEEANHPNIVKAMHDIGNSMKALHNAPDDFGGHKGQAESDLKQAWISLRKALYYRIYQDTH
jgi:hypothetical protein